MGIDAGALADELLAGRNWRCTARPLSRLRSTTRATRVAAVFHAANSSSNCSTTRISKASSVSATETELAERTGFVLYFAWGVGKINSYIQTDADHKSHRADGIRGGRYRFNQNAG